MPGVRPGFNADTQAEAIHKAIKGMGTDDSALITAITQMTHEERVLVSAAYSHKFQASMLSDVHGDTGGNYRDLLEKLVLPRGECMARCLHDAMAGAGTDDYQLIILLSCFSLDVPAAAEAYKRIYKKDLLEAVKGETSGDYERTLYALVTRVPPHPAAVNPAQAKADAEALYKAGEKRLGTDDDTFIQIITGRSNAHLVEVDRIYTASYKNSLVRAIEKETSGNYELVLKSLVMPRYEVLARAVDHAVSGAGTEEHLLNLIFSLCEREELTFVAQEYQRIAKKDMADRLKKDVSFNYEKLLLALLRA
jgi:hypothetical protein